MVKPSDVDTWATMRSRLWPRADARQLADEARAFIAGAAVPGLSAVFIAGDQAAVPLGFLELSVRAFADSCDSAPVPHVEGWYVEPAARGNGIGRGLTEHAEQWSRAHGFTELASDTDIENEASLQAHTSCGFEEIERLVKFRKLLR